MSASSIARPANLRVEVEEAKPSFLSTGSWILYDFAFHFFAFNIVSVYFPLFVKNLGQDDWVYSVPQSLAQLVIAFTCPLVGALSDRGGGRRLPWLTALTLIAIVFAVGMGLVPSSGLWLIILFYVLSNIGYQTALLFYDSLLPSVSTTTTWGTISGWGQGIGYIGALAGGLVVGKIVNVSAGFEQNGFIPSALLYLVFAIPCFFLVKERKVRLTAQGRIEAEEASGDALRPGLERGLTDVGKDEAASTMVKEVEPNDYRFDWRSLRHSLSQTWRTLKDTRDYPGLFPFLVSNFFYTDAMNTVIIAMGVYATEVVGFKDATSVLAPAIVAAVIGSAIFGYVTDGLSSKQGLIISLLLWMVVFVALIVFTDKIIFQFVIAPLAGIALGSVWVEARTMMIELSPPERLGEFMGIYNITGRFAAVIGPLIWGGTLFLFNPKTFGRLGYQIAIGALLLMIVVGFVIHLSTPNIKRSKDGQKVIKG